MKEGDNIIWCDWCGGSPYYISVYEDVDTEALICKECYNNYYE